MPVPTNLSDLATTAGSNFPAGSNSPADLDDTQRAHASFIAQLRDGAHVPNATAKTTPVDADLIPINDSAASNIIKKVTWANVKATLKTYFDTLYAATGSYLTAGAVTSSGLTQATARLLGRTTASTGAIEEISVGASLTLSGGTLSVTDSHIGYSQSWSNPTRAVGTTYTNSTGKPIQVQIGWTAASGGGEFRINGTARFTTYGQTTGSWNAIIPPGDTYAAIQTSGAFNTNNWAELS